MARRRGWIEYVVADLDVVTRRLEKLGISGRHGTASEQEQNAREEALSPDWLRRRGGTTAPRAGGSDDDERLARGFRFLSQKPQLVVLNVGDDDQVAGAAAREAEEHGAHGGPSRDVIVLGGRIEAEIAALGANDARLFLDDLGIAEPSRTG